jgi:AbrB family looped-hinge helix DNA binding protein
MEYKGKPRIHPTYQEWWDGVQYSHERTIRPFVMDRRVQMGVRVLVDDRGRLSIPAEIRKQLGFREGDKVIIEPLGPGEFRVIKMRAAAESGKGMYSNLRGPGERVSDELIRDRRREQRESEE